MRTEAIIALIVFATSPCWAQKRLSLKEAVDQALSSRASIRAEAERVASAQGIRTQAGLLPNPQFQFQNENLRPGQTYGRDVDTLALINQPLDILGKRKQRVAVANDGVTLTQAEYDLARWRLAQRVKLAYWAALGSQEIHNVLERTVDNFQKIVDYHAAQLSAGAIAEQDLLRVRLEAERFKISTGLASIAANRARFELLKEMGETDFPSLDLTESLTSTPDVTPLSIDEVLARRMEVKVARAAVQQAEAAARLADVSARPDLDVTYGYKRTQLFDTTTGVNTAVAGLRITLPVTDKNQGNRIAAEAEVRRQRQLLAEAETQIRAEYDSARQEYQMRRSEALNALQPLREHAATIASIASAAYAEGGTDLLRLLDAERARLDAELAWTQGMVDYRRSMVQLEAAEGVDQ